MKNKDFNLIILFFSFFTVMCYLNLRSFKFIILVSLAIFLYEIFITFHEVSSNKKLLTLNIILALITLIFVFFKYDFNQQPIIHHQLIIVNLFFIYNLLFYIFYKHTSIILLIICWILCNAIPMLVLALAMLFIKSRGMY